MLNMSYTFQDQTIGENSVLHRRIRSISLSLLCMLDFVFRQMVRLFV